MCDCKTTSHTFKTTQTMIQGVSGFVLTSFHWLYGDTGTGSGSGSGVGETGALSRRGKSLNETGGRPHPCPSPRRHPQRGLPALSGQAGGGTALGLASSLPEDKYQIIKRQILHRG